MDFGWLWLQKVSEPCMKHADDIYKNMCLFETSRWTCKHHPRSLKQDFRSTHAMHHRLNGLLCLCGTSPPQSRSSCLDLVFPLGKPENVQYQLVNNKHGYWKPTLLIAKSCKIIYLNGWISIYIYIYQSLFTRWYHEKRLNNRDLC